LLVDGSTCDIIRPQEAFILDAIELARKSVEAASDKQANDIVMLDTRGVCSFADYFVICSGETRRQIEAICDEIHGVLIRGRAGC